MIYECEICGKKLRKNTVTQITMYSEPYKDIQHHTHFELCKACFKSVNDFLYAKFKDAK